MVTHKFRVTLSEDNAIWLMRQDDKSKAIDSLITAYRESKKLVTVEQIDEKLENLRKVFDDLTAQRQQLIEVED